MILTLHELRAAYRLPENIVGHNFRQSEHDTQGLLCLRYPDLNAYHRFDAARNDKNAPEEDRHAEPQLLSSPRWTTTIPTFQKMLDQDSRSNQWGLITMVLNRSPCERCSKKLAKALQSIPHREKSRFVLACLGEYAEYDDDGKELTETNLKRLIEAGWEVCVLRSATGKVTWGGSQLAETLRGLIGAAAYPESVKLLDRNSANKLAVSLPVTGGKVNTKIFANQRQPYVTLQ